MSHGSEKIGSQNFEPTSNKGVRGYHGQLYFFFDFLIFTPQWTECTVSLYTQCTILRTRTLDCFMASTGVNTTTKLRGIQPLVCGIEVCSNEAFDIYTTHFTLCIVVATSALTEGTECQ